MADMVTAAGATNPALLHMTNDYGSGLADAFETAICLVEWPDRLGDAAPAGALTLELAPEGAEWRPGRDYEIVGEIGGGAQEGCNSVVFRIRTAARGEEYALKMVVHIVGDAAPQRRGHQQHSLPLPHAPLDHETDVGPQRL